MSVIALILSPWKENLTLERFSSLIYFSGESIQVSDSLLKTPSGLAWILASCVNFFYIRNHLQPRYSREIENIVSGQDVQNVFIIFFAFLVWRSVSYLYIRCVFSPDTFHAKKLTRSVFLIAGFCSDWSIFVSDNQLKRWWFWSLIFFNGKNDSVSDNLAWMLASCVNVSFTREALPAQIVSWNRELSIGLGNQQVDFFPSLRRQADIDRICARANNSGLSTVVDSGQVWIKCLGINSCTYLWAL